jgi:hypothetical protein
MAVWEGEIKPHVTDEILADKIDASVQYVYSPRDSEP